ncbi:thiamine-phosphate kinase [Campylobacter hepaticus]|uniref:Thiamine-monophosphate kinase n=1 Tax=Campylobacter hepaticus TaxID=1813019 RepID=A0A424YYN7_9BACT|nr:thiamine-phosphate kinase [Campylobacter hepaticus]AXP09062.1 thiamine-phosphate kinase [Campylobacter hepaticus]MCZ0771892.1 thiamine-phosphate kinase [Campylobacter hepaticus]MCZ0773019.1 thiamine-phosphate kinase [Campylobacter hepaticus]MCZ0773361.1 thiamine-phosphate kinase [Campylobacter hepaticus]MCZ0774612.1 thiamine-phosphate kinase [Campylobacter hepaticus]
MNKEDFIIQAFLNKKNGDDGAIVGKWCFSKDLFFENIHFKREWFDLEQIATKAMLVNISDAIVMNAKPKYALLGLALPKNLSEDEIVILQKGFLKTASQFDIEIIGGDTISNDKIDISITIISKLNGKAVFRKGLKPGHLLAYTGDLGGGLEGLNTLQNGGILSLDHVFIKPRLRPDFFYELAPYISCAMDISDGLSKDLSRLLKQNKCGISWFESLSDNILYSGEEYEILFAFDEKEYENIANIAKKHQVKINVFAKAVKGKYEFSGKEHHF